MLVPLLVLDGLLAAALLMLLIRHARLRAEAETVPERLTAAQARADRAIAALRRATETGPATDAAETRPDSPAERRPRRRVRRIGPTATPDRP